jgi:hypothetical protein
VLRDRRIAFRRQDRPWYLKLCALRGRHRLVAKRLRVPLAEVRATKRGEPVSMELVGRACRLALPASFDDSFTVHRAR